MRQRIEWIDLVKAGSVLLVVFMHAANLLADLGGRTWLTGLLHDFNYLVEPLRMPVFFLVSGMLASSAVRRPWRASTNRTAGMVYLYVLWMLLYFGFIALFGATVSDPAGSILFARSGYWYLYAMGVFFVIARLLRDAPAWAVVALALVPNLLRPLIDAVVADLIPGSLVTSMSMNLGFFIAGAYFKELIGRLAERATWWSTAFLGALAVGSGIAWSNTPGTAGQSYLALSVVWVAFGVSLAVQVTRRVSPAWAKYVGARTLPVYVMQWPVLFLTAEFLPGSALGNPVAQVLFAPLFTALVAGVALWMHTLSALTPLFHAPAWVTHPRIPEQVRARASATEPFPVTTGR